MLLSDLQSKDIISIKNGENIGRIIDVEIDNEGKIVRIYVENKKIFRRYLKDSDITFKYSDIEKVGTDCILVKL